MSDHTGEPPKAQIEMWGATPDGVTTRPLDAGRCWIGIQADNIKVTLYGPIADLRATFVEIDRQLAHLEVAHLIDQATDGEEG